MKVALAFLGRIVFRPRSTKMRSDAFLPCTVPNNYQLFGRSSPSSPASHHIKKYLQDKNLEDIFGARDGT
jgi:hypothetical protein